MIVNEALEFLRQYSFSLYYKIQGASRDAEKTAQVKELQCLLASSLVHHHLLQHLLKDVPGIGNSPLDSPLSDNLDWFEEEFQRFRLKPLNANDRLGYTLLQQQPYSNIAEQELVNLEVYSWLYRAIKSTRKLMTSAPAVPVQMTPPVQSTKASASTLTPCMMIALMNMQSRSQMSEDAVSSEPDSDYNAADYRPISNFSQ